MSKLASKPAIPLNGEFDLDGDMTYRAVWAYQATYELDSQEGARACVAFADTIIAELEK